MHFVQLFAIALGLAAFVSAVPSANERRMVWTPRSLRPRKEDGGKEKGKGSVDIVDTTVVKLTEEKRNSEVELTILVKEKVKIEEQKNKAKDNVRKNHYRNKNKGSNTVIQVITKIIDIRDSNNENTRFMKHEVRADNKAQKDITIQVTEVEAITISNNNHKQDKSGGGGGHKATKAGHGDHSSDATAASGAVASAIQTVDPNAPFTASNQTVLLPSGAAAPQGQTEDFDPAALVEDLAADLVVQQVSG